jgi:transposase
MAYICGEGRSQGTLFPAVLDDLVTLDHMCRVVDAFVGQLDMDKLGFGRAEPADTGRPGYDPRSLLKLYLYGFLNQIRSSRRLEAECRRNVEVMWLLERLYPGYKSIAEFRRKIGPQFQSLSDSFDCLGFLLHHDPPFLFVSGKDQSAVAHHLADQIVDGHKHFDGGPDKLLQPHFMQDAFEPGHEVSNGRILPEDLVKDWCAILQIPFHPVDMAEQAAATDKRVLEDLLNLTKDLARATSVAMRSYLLHRRCKATGLYRL